MKLSFRGQRNICVIIIILFNIISTIAKHWIYHSVGWVLCGLLFLLNPVVPEHLENNKKAVFWVRVAGVICILVGIFTRSYLY